MFSLPFLPLLSYPHCTSLLHPISAGAAERDEGSWTQVRVSERISAQFLLNIEVTGRQFDKGNKPESFEIWDQTGLPPVILALAEVSHILRDTKSYHEVGWAGWNLKTCHQKRQWVTQGPNVENGNTETQFDEGDKTMQILQEAPGYYRRFLLSPRRIKESRAGRGTAEKDAESQCI